MKRVYDFLKEAGTYYLATDDNGQPRVRPFGTIDVFDGGLCFQTGLSKKVAQELLANPAFEISAMRGGEWIRLSGKAVLDDRREARVHMLEEYPSLKAMYDPDDGNTAVFRIENATATICSFSAPPVEIAF
ncbi:MAG: pyridoxamine 5'-phosphate oxidase family protein [Clostridia bacterium]|nr:pyridoxamine 5'-phosphate oxidase family protein [Clostridia bacterium]